MALELFFLCWKILGCIVALGLAGIVLFGSIWVCNEIRRDIRNRLS